MTNVKWKDYLLKSGIPLEYSILKYLWTKHCVSKFEYSYFKLNEHAIENEFSFDIDASYIKGDKHWFNLLIECKYRDQSTNWLFIPEKPDLEGKTTNISFLHPSDYFTPKNKFDYDFRHMPLIAKLSSKGIEITSDGNNPKTITQAVNQISYAMAKFTVKNMENQFDTIFRNTIFYNVPVIVTTANIHRLKDDVTIEEIKKSNVISDIATKEDMIILQVNGGIDLLRHNHSVFNAFIDRHGDKILEKKLKRYSKDIYHVRDVISSSLCPEAMIILQYTPENIAFEKLFEFLDEVASPSAKTLNYIKAESARIDREVDELFDFKIQKKRISRITPHHQEEYND